MIKINCRRLLGRLSTNVMTLLLIQIHSETNIFLSTKVIWEREKRGLITNLSAWSSDRRVCLKVLTSRKNEKHLWIMATKVGMYSATYESVTVPVGRNIYLNTDRAKNQSDCRIIAAPSDKKINLCHAMSRYVTLDLWDWEDLFGNILLVSCLAYMQLKVVVKTFRCQISEEDWFGHIC